MNVLHFYRTYLPETHGGVEEAIRQICMATSRLGVQHRVLTLARIPQVDVVDRPEARVIRAPLNADLASCSMGVALFRLYKEHAAWADVVHFHYPWPFADLVHLTSAIRKPILLTYHSDIIRQKKLEYLYRPLRNRLFSDVECIVATSPNYLQTSPVLQSVRDKTRVIPLGLETGEPHPVTASVRVEVERQFGTGFFLFIGVLRYYKGLYILLQAAATSGLPVVIAGAGPEEVGLKEFAAREGITNVIFAGFVSDEVKHALLEQCLAVVFPSFVRSEAFGVTLLEGQSYSKPLVSCEIGTGTSYVNQHGVTGLVIPPNDSDALAGAMAQLKSDPQEATRMGQAGRDRLETVFSSRRIGQDYLLAYRDTMGAAHETSPSEAGP